MSPEETKAFVASVIERAGSILVLHLGVGGDRINYGK